MNKRLITIGLISGTVIVSSMGIAIPKPSMGIANMAMESSSLSIALQVFKESAKRKMGKLNLEEHR